MCVRVIQNMEYRVLHASICLVSKLERVGMFTNYSMQRQGFLKTGPTDDRTVYAKDKSSPSSSTPSSLSSSSPISTSSTTPMDNFTAVSSDTINIDIAGNNSIGITSVNNNNNIVIISRGGGVYASLQPGDEVFDYFNGREDRT
ncbi:hypothetical protein ElyMa_006014800 [Elysia marginata]|uniref:PDZ domain-containing protein n=1 Tax=Elysia marginata TaxID=1093978 RepID=A0AAV4GKI7_9GAST|nr:hypothetical protein ElyMa_006014800 [Elysia marginata]